MKNIYIISLVLLLISGGCKKETSHRNDTVIVVDVTKENYPHKEITLQDFMDVEYIALETSDTFLCQGHILAVGKDFIVARNQIQDDAIFIFDRKKGKGITKINRKGPGNEEYAIAYQAVLDENNKELFIYDVIQNKIMVYDLYGKYKRHFMRHKKDRINHIYNYNRENLICHIDNNNATSDKSTFLLLSKQTGETVHEIAISYKEKKSMKIADNGNLLMLYPYPSILSFRNHWILSEISSDTVFQLSPEYNMTPIIIKKPSIQSTTPETFLFPQIFTNRYHFIGKVKKRNDFSTTNLIYDNQEKEIYKYTMYNRDYVNAQKINIAELEILNEEAIFYKKMEAYKLVEAYNNGELKGELKNIAAELDEESNPVIMIAKDKKLPSKWLR